MNKTAFVVGCRYVVASLCVLALCACGSLRPSTTPLPTFYTLDGKVGASDKSLPASVPPTAPTLIISPPQVAAGFDSPRILYVREAQHIEYFAYSEWIDSPPRMLAPLLVTALENSGAFRSVMLTPSSAHGDLRLATEIVRLQHEFQTTPSRAHFTLRATITDAATQRVLGWREFDETKEATSEDAYGGVMAANRAVQSVLQQLAQFCAETARQWQSAPAPNLRHSEKSLLEP
jgi:cholesterol transport system auxiliary component